MGDWLPGVPAKPKHNRDWWDDTVTHDEISFHPQQLDKANVNHLNAEPGSNCHAFYQSSQYHTLGQIKSLWGKRLGLELSTEPCIPPLNSLPNGGQNLDCKLLRKEAGPRAQHRTLYFTSQHTTTRKSAQKLVRKEAGWELITEPSVPPAIIVPRRGQTESLWGKRRGENSSQNPLFHQSS